MDFFDPQIYDYLRNRFCLTVCAMAGVLRLPCTTASIPDFRAAGELGLRRRRVSPLPAPVAAGDHGAAAGGSAWSEMDPAIVIATAVVTQPRPEADESLGVARYVGTALAGKSHASIEELSQEAFAALPLTPASESPARPAPYSAATSSSCE